MIQSVSLTPRHSHPGHRVRSFLISLVATLEGSTETREVGLPIFVCRAGDLRPSATSVTFAPATNSALINSNYGVVLKATRCLDAFANTTTNTVGAGGTDYDIFNQTLPNQEGPGYDFGLRGNNRHENLVGSYEFDQGPLKGGRVSCSALAGHPHHRQPGKGQHVRCHSCVSRQRLPGHGCVRELRLAPASAREEPELDRVAPREKSAR